MPNGVNNRDWAEVFAENMAKWRAAKQRGGQPLVEEPSGLGRVLGTLTTPFRIYHEKVVEPISALALAPFAPDLPAEAGESFLERKRREYEAWEAPRFAKGVSEFALDPLWLVGLGLPALGAKGLARVGLAGAAKAALKLQKADTLVAKAMAAPLLPVTKPLGKLAGKVMRPRVEAGLTPDLQDFDQAVQVAIQPDNARRLANLPIIRSLLKTFNPLAVAEKPGDLAVAGKALLMEEGRVKSTVAFAELDQLGSFSKVMGKVTRDGVFAEGSLKGLDPYDVLTYPGRHPLTPQQIEYAQRMGQLYGARLDLLKRAGIDINELSFEEGGQYIGRKVYGKVTAEGDLVEVAFIGAGGARPGAKLGAEKHRIFKTAAEAVEKGYRYLSPEEALYFNIQGAYNRVANKQMSEWLLSHPAVTWRTQGAPESLKVAAETATTQLRQAVTFKAVIERALRGEKPPEATLRALERRFPDQGAKLIASLGDKKALRALRPDANALIRQARTERIITVNRRSIAADLAGQTAIGEARIMSPAFAGKILTGPQAMETARIINQALEPKYSNLLGRINSVNAVVRFMVLAGDASPMFIQLLFLAPSHPKAWLMAARGFVRGFFDPRYHARQLSKNAALIQKYPSYLSTRGGASEFTEAMARGGLLRRGPLKIVGRILEPFQRGFEGSIEDAGIQMLKSLDHMGTSPRAIEQIGQFVNEIRGLASSSRLGVSTTTRQWETVSLLAPRYTRAIAALMFDVFRGNLRGSLARDAMARSMAAMAAITVKVSEAMGETEEQILEHLNPASPRFMTWQIAGQNIGPGTKVRSLMVLLARSVQEPEDYLKPFTDSERFFYHMFNTPGLKAFSRFVRSNLAPVVSTSVDLLTGENFVGDPTRDGLLSFSEAVVAENLLPVWVQSVVLEGLGRRESGGLGGAATRGAAEFLGGRGYPTPPLQKFQAYVEKETGQPYGDIPRHILKSFQQTDTRGKELWEAFEADQARRDKAGELGVLVRAIRNTRIADLEIEAQKVRAGDIGHSALREFIQQSGQTLGAKYAALELIPAYADALAEWRAKPKEIPADEVYRRYMQIINDPILDRGAEGYDYETRDRLVAELRALAGEELWATLEQNLALDRLDYPQEVQDYYATIDRLKPYWDIEKNFVATLSPAIQQMWLRYTELLRRGLNEEARALDARSRGLFTQIRSIIGRRREALRIQDPDIDAMLRQWYGYVPIGEQR